MVTLELVLSIVASVVSIIAAGIGLKNSSEIKKMNNSNNRQLTKNGGVNVIGDHNAIGRDDGRH